MERVEVEKTIFKIKQVIHRSLNNRQYERALKIVSLCANILYDTNILYMDPDLEIVLQQLAQILLPSEICKNIESSMDDKSCNNSDAKALAGGLLIAT